MESNGHTKSIMNIVFLSRRLSACRPRFIIILAILLLPFFGIVWRQFRTSDHHMTTEYQPDNIPAFDSKQFRSLPNTDATPHRNDTTVKENDTVKHSNKSMYTSTEVLEARRQKWMDVCAKHPQLNGIVHGVFTHKSGVLYCFVPKAGCTFWKQVFNFASASDKDKEKYSSPWDYPRMLVHNNYMAKGRKFNENSDEKNFPTRVVVSRDPFSRILSSYLDKFYLPDFWLILGVGYQAKERQSTITNFFTEHFKNMDDMFRHTYRPGDHRQCGSHLTFGQFLSNSRNTYEPHWLPVHKICNPCKLKPTHVVKMETFTSDARVVMKQMGLDHLLNDLDPVDQTNKEIETITEYNFNAVYGKNENKFRGCVSREELAYRLWTNFRWRGYIHPDIDYVIPEPGRDVKEDLGLQLVKSRQAAIKDPASCKKFKNDFKISAFKSLDKTLFEAIVKMYEIDTQLFGHEEIIEKMRAIYT